jgi:rubredoxin/uncharacterized membrane protein
MKKWKCGVCGYIHTGAEAPERCPVCGADRSQFILLEETAVDAPSPAPHPDGAEGSHPWICGVCRYPHAGASPPPVCPVCGSDAAKFAMPGGAPSAAPQVAAPDIGPREAPQPPPPIRLARWEPLLDRLSELHAHPISVHIPNGVLPVAALFLFLGLLFGSPALEKASFYNLSMVFLAMPAVLFSGYNDWQRRFEGRMTYVFRTKLVCGLAVQALSLVLVIWRAIQPGIVLEAHGAGRFFYLVLFLLALGCAITAGYMGGKLVVFPGGRGKRKGA